MPLSLIRVTAYAAALSTVGPSAVVSCQLDARSAEEWIEVLDRPLRINSLKIDDVIVRLRLEPGDVLADIGAGTGVFSLPFARAVAPGGKVYAVEVDQVLVDHVSTTAREHGVSNIEAVLGGSSDPRIPKREVDLAFFHDVLHHIENREGYLKNLARYIKPAGRVAIIERGHQASGRHMHLSQEQVTRWMADAGFHIVEEHDLYDGGKWFVVYARRGGPSRGHPVSPNGRDR